MLMVGLLLLLSFDSDSIQSTGHFNDLVSVKLQFELFVH